MYVAGYCEIDSLMASECVFVVAECGSIAQVRGDGDKDEKEMECITRCDDW